MLKFSRSLAIAILATSVIVSCKKQTFDEKGVAFSISDTMLEKCEFYDASLQEVKNDVRLYGKITVDNNRMAHVNSVVGGNVMAIYAELGDYVKQGQPLATVRSSEVAEFQREKLDALGEVGVAEKNLQV